MFLFCRIGDNWSDICEQTELTLSPSLEFDPETTEKVDLPLTRRKSNIENLSESQILLNIESPSTAENTSGVKLLPIESVSDTNTDNDCTSSIAPLNDCDAAQNEQSKCSREEPKSGNASLDVKANDAETKTAFVFSIENVPSGCYYLSRPNKYVFPGSTYTWYGSGDPDKDREEIYEDDNDEEDYDEDEDDDYLESHNDHSPIAVENSNSDNNVSVKESDSALLGKRVGEVAVDSAEHVSPAKQQKIIDEDLGQ